MEQNMKGGEKKWKRHGSPFTFLFLILLVHHSLFFMATTSGFPGDSTVRVIHPLGW